MSFFSAPPLTYVRGLHPQFTILWLHGLGADGHDFRGLADALAAIGPSGMRFVFPHAPMQRVTLNGGLTMPAWFDLYGTGPTDPQDAAGIHEAAAAISALILAEGRHGIPPERVILGGFSQGGALALHVGLTGAAALAAVIALSTYLPLAPTVAAAGVRHPQTPLFMAHGIDDRVVPLPCGEQSRDLLVAAGLSVVFNTYRMGHTVIDEEIADIRAFLTPIMSAPALGAPAASR
ncbi:MAG: alpha/beta hydrolase [Acidiferrobacter sp.]